MLIVTCAIFIFAFGACIGSFLNVVVYRMPREKSLVFPPSACPGCGKRIALYDNIPILSWLLLGGKCRKCKMKISARYPSVELFTALIFMLVFLWYFNTGHDNFVFKDMCSLEAFSAGGWVFYALHMILISALIAASAIDLELWIIPLPICWFVTAAGIIGSAIGRIMLGAGIETRIVGFYRVFPPMDSAAMSAIAIGASIGLIISLIALFTKIIKPSYLLTEADQDLPEDQQPDFPHRKEMLKEVVFLLPIILSALICFIVYKTVDPAAIWWADVSQIPVVAGVTSSLFGYFIGCAVVWLTRILGTFAFGKEAMGLGDVHLMGAAGAVIGPVFVTVAFFIAPFFGLLWAGYQMFFKKTRQIPYGPFLSLGLFAVMIFHVWFSQYLAGLYVL